MLRSILHSTTKRLHQQRHHSSLPQSFTHDTSLPNKKILIANRDEISLRIQRAAAALGCQSVAVCAERDLDSPHVESADEYVVLKEGDVGESGGAIGPYLNVKALTKVCVERGVDLVHPGELLIQLI